MKLETPSRQQAAVAELGLKALENTAWTTLLDEALALIARILEVEYCQVLELLPDGQTLLLRAGVGWQDRLIGQMTISTAADSEAGYTLHSGGPVIVEDLSQERRFIDAPLLHEQGVVSGLSVIIHRRGDRPFGVLGAHTTRRRSFTQDDVYFLQAIANVLAPAIEHRRAEEAIQESKERFRALLESAPVAVVIVDRRGHIALVNGKTEAMFGYQRPELVGYPLEILLPERFRQSHVGHRANYLAQPRVRPMGLGLDLAGRRKNGSEFPVEIGLSFIETEGETLAMSFITDITERRQVEQSLQAAVAAERNRLARDLHDAVTQTLFSASLIAEVLPRLWERNPGEGERRLAELRQLTRGALAEMRTLLLELRPAALMEVELGDLLRQLAEGITGRARVPVALTVEGYYPLTADVRVALYRIAQEALNNVAKHAGANQAVVSLRYLGANQQESGKAGEQADGLQDGASVELCISDDGRGFDPRRILPESLGLNIMRERVEAIGATLVIESQVGQGTHVSVVWKPTKLLLQ